MYPVSNEFKEAVRAKVREFQVKVEIAGIEYSGNSLVEMSIEDNLTSIDDLTIGEAVSSKLSMTIKTRNIFKDGDQANPYIRVRLVDDFSEWMPLGKFFISEMVNKLGVWELTCYDALTTLLQPYWSDLIFPAKMTAVMAEIAGQIDLEFDSSVVVNPDHEISYITGELTYREVIRFIAGAHLSSVKMTRDGKLAWVNFFPAQPASEITRGDYFKLDRTNSVRTITKVIVTNSIEGETVYIEKGEGTEYQTLRFECPYITQQMLDELFPRINGFTYTPYSMDYKCFPELETGDKITFWQDESLTWADADINWGAADINWDGLVEHASIILSSTITFKGSLRGKLAASTKSEQEKAYQFGGTLGQEIIRLNRDAVQETRHYNGVKITRAKGIEVLRNDGKVEVSMSATDGIRIQADRNDQGYLTDVFYLDTNGNLKIVSDDFVTFESLSEPGATVINGGNITTGYIEADRIRGGELSGVTINVDTDGHFGENIYLGGMNGVRIENDGGAFYLRVGGLRALRFYNNGFDVDGSIGVYEGSGIFTHYGVTSETSSRVDNIRFWSDIIRIWQPGSAGVTEIWGRLDHRGDRLGFFNVTPVARQRVNAPTPIQTTQSANTTYGSNERTMLNNLRVDVVNLRNRLYDVIDALYAYGLV